MIRPDDGKNESVRCLSRRFTVRQRPADDVQARVGFGDLSCERLAGGGFGEAGDHDEREVSADDGLATGVDIPIASAHGRTERSDNARMIIGEHMVYNGMGMLSMHGSRIASAGATFNIQSETCPISIDLVAIVRRRHGRRRRDFFGA